MLREIQGVRQYKPGLRRRWYQDEFFDLYTWQALDGSLIGFQMCYDLPGRERAITWHREHGFSHNKVDSGGRSGHMSVTPLLVAAGRFPHRMVRLRFIASAATLDAATRNAVIDRMREYGRAIARGIVTVPRRVRPPADKADPA